MRARFDRGQRTERELWIKGHDLHSTRRFLQEGAEDVGLHGRSREQAVQAASEAIANAIEHGSNCLEGDVHVRIAREGGLAVFYVSDCGTFRDEAALAMEMPDPMAERGRGLPLIAAVMDEVDVVRESGRTTIRMGKRRRALSVV